MKQIGWLWDKNNRAVISLVGAAIAALAIAGWTVFIHFEKTDAPTERTVERTYHLCRGENGFICHSENSIFIGCRQFSDWASEQCIKWKFGPSGGASGPADRPQRRCEAEETTLYCTTNP
jgi:hypothetical protein